MKTEKTIKEWLETLPDGIREEALANMGKGGSRAITLSVGAALLSAFDWTASPQGMDYWDDVYENLLDDSLFGNQERTNILDEIDEAVQAAWDANLQPIRYIWLAKDAVPANCDIHRTAWERWGTRVVLLSEFFKNRTDKFLIKV